MELRDGIYEIDDRFMEDVIQNELNTENLLYEVDSVLQQAEAELDLINDYKNDLNLLSIHKGVIGNSSTISEIFNQPVDAYLTFECDNDPCQLVDCDVSTFEFNNVALTKDDSVVTQSSNANIVKQHNICDQKKDPFIDFPPNFSSTPLRPKFTNTYFSPLTRHKKRKNLRLKSVKYLESIPEQNEDSFDSSTLIKEWAYEIGVSQNFTNVSADLISSQIIKRIPEKCCKQYEQILADDLSLPEADASTVTTDVLKKDFDQIGLSNNQMIEHSILSNKQIELKKSCCFIPNLQKNENQIMDKTVDEIHSIVLFNHSHQEANVHFNTHTKQLNINTTQTVSTEQSFEINNSVFDPIKKHQQNSFNEASQTLYNDSSKSEISLLHTIHIIDSETDHIFSKNVVNKTSTKWDKVIILSDDEILLSDEEFEKELDSIYNESVSDKYGLQIEKCENAAVLKNNNTTHKNFSSNAISINNLTSNKSEKINRDAEQVDNESEVIIIDSSNDVDEFMNYSITINNDLIANKNYGKQTQTDIYFDLSSNENNNFVINSCDNKFDDELALNFSTYNITVDNDLYNISDSDHNSNVAGVTKSPFSQTDYICNNNDLTINISKELNKRTVTVNSHIDNTTSEPVILDVEKNELLHNTSRNNNELTINISHELNERTVTVNADSDNTSTESVILDGQKSELMQNTSKDNNDLTINIYNELNERTVIAHSDSDYTISEPVILDMEKSELMQNTSKDNNDLIINTSNELNERMINSDSDPITEPVILDMKKSELRQNTSKDDLNEEFSSTVIARINEKKSSCCNNVQILSNNCDIQYIGPHNKVSTIFTINQNAILTCMDDLENSFENICNNFKATPCLTDFKPIKKHNIDHSVIRPKARKELIFNECVLDKTALRDITNLNESVKISDKKRNVSPQNWVKAKPTIEASAKIEVQYIDMSPLEEPLQMDWKSNKHKEVCPHTDDSFQENFVGIENVEIVDDNQNYHKSSAEDGKSFRCPVLDNDQRKITRGDILTENDSLTKNKTIKTPDFNRKKICLPESNINNVQNNYNATYISGEHFQLLQSCATQSDHLPNDNDKEHNIPSQEVFVHINDKEETSSVQIMNCKSATGESLHDSSLVKEKITLLKSDITENINNTGCLNVSFRTELPITEKLGANNEIMVIETKKKLDIAEKDSMEGGQQINTKNNCESGRLNETDREELYLFLKNTSLNEKHIRNDAEIQQNNDIQIQSSNVASLKPSIGRTVLIGMTPAKQNDERTVLTGISPMKPNIERTVLTETPMKQNAQRTVLIGITPLKPNARRTVITGFTPKKQDVVKLGTNEVAHLIPNVEKSTCTVIASCSTQNLKRPAPIANDHDHMAKKVKLDEPCCSKMVDGNVNCNAHDVSKQNFTRLIFDGMQTWDENDPNWIDIKDLRTADELFNHIHSQWQTDSLPNPHKCLTKRYVRGLPKKGSMKILPNKNRTYPMCTFYKTKIKLCNDQIWSMQNKIRKLHRQVYFNKKKELEYNEQISEIINKINNILKFKEEILTINRFYVEKEGGRDAQFVDHEQFEDLKMQDQFMDRMTQFYENPTKKNFN